VPVIQIISTNRTTDKRLSNTENVSLENGKKAKDLCHGTENTVLLSGFTIICPME
jgi:hypothetical protein